MHDHGFIVSHNPRVLKFNSRHLVLIDEILAVLSKQEENGRLAQECSKHWETGQTDDMMRRSILCHVYD